MISDNKLREALETVMEEQLAELDEKMKNVTVSRLLCEVTGSADAPPCPKAEKTGLDSSI